jgi:hypothetical protein
MKIAMTPVAIEAAHLAFKVFQDARRDPQIRPNRPAGLRHGT